LLFSDVSSGQINSTITPGGIGLLKGHLLKFNPSEETLGVFLSPVENPHTTMRVQVYSIIKPSQIHFQIPMLNAGRYTLSVKTVPRFSKHLRQGQFKYQLTVIHVPI
jgi:hypothetical protein